MVRGNYVYTSATEYARNVDKFDRAVDQHDCVIMLCCFLIYLDIDAAIPLTHIDAAEIALYIDRVNHEAN